MIALAAAVFLASLVGSLHCAGMCGAFVAIACSGGSRAATQAGYHLGRLATYVGLGAVAGWAGAAVDVAGAWAGLRPIALSLSAATVTLFGLTTWLRLKGVALPAMRGPAFAQKLASRGYDVAMRRPPVQRAAIIGLLTTLLPCGWLWTFLVTAAGTTNPVNATGVMFVFWLGTLPAMVALGAGLRGLLGGAQRRVPTLTCASMVAVGLFTILGRAPLDPTRWAKAATTAPTDHKAPCCKDVADANAQ